jgi:formylglycine-generating enzyme required for sulfatase activity/predicted Ser/Thr protein kinase
MLSPNTILRDRYRIIHQLGKGGMGAVYQAMDENLSCVVAVKETFAANDEQRRAFRREAELLANLSHFALPRVMDHFNHGDGQFLVMQYVPGHDLSELLELREQPFSVAKVLGWADQLLDALEELHSSDPPIIHRDIKPANLKVTPKGKVLLLDFGLAKGFAGQMSTAAAESQGKSIYGYTPHYAPIEQMRGAGTDPRSDLYSLAATMWTLLTGKVPPDALSRVAEKEDGNADPLLSAHEINPGVPEPISKLLNRAMALNRNQRPATAAEMRNALRDAAETEVERPTLILERPNALESSSVPSAPPLKSTIKVPEPLQSSPSNPHYVPTMPAVSPPALQSWEDYMSSSTASSSAGEAGKGRGSQKRIALIVASVLVVAIAIVVVGWSGWRPWAGEQSGSAGPAQPNQERGENVTVNPAAPAGMVYVPGGEFMMGRNASDGGDEYERPAHNVTVKPFFIDQYEVTNDDYAKFVKETNHRPPSNWANGSYPAGAGRKPVIDVAWDDGNDFAKWAGKRLPTEEEWEFAARGTDGRRYPSGNDWKPGDANADSANAGLVDVGTYKGKSPFGAYDMVGNAWEWTASKLIAYPGGKLPQLPPDNVRVIRGGSYDESANEATTTYRGFLKASGDNYDKTGFRCVKDK